MAHITGGGLLDNLPRVLPDNLNAVVDLPSSGWELPPVFKWLQTLANLPQVRSLSLQATHSQYDPLLYPLSLYVAYFENSPMAF